MVQVRRHKRFGPLRVGLTQNGLSFSVGNRILRLGVGPDGRVRRTVRVPGVGIYDTRVIRRPQ